MLDLQTKTRTEQVLAILRVFAWIACIGYLVYVGAILISFVVSFTNPEAAKNLYRGVNLYYLKQFNIWHYSLHVVNIIAVLILKSLVCFFMIKALSKITLVDPFKIEVARILEKISFLLLVIWSVALAGGAHAEWLVKTTGKHYGDWFSGEFLFSAGLIFVISQIFKRGVEIQSENDLTV